MDGSRCMNDPQAKALSSLAALIDKIALELVFAEPASDGGLLPINSFINEMEETTHAVPLPAAALDGIARGRGLIDGVFASTGQFSRENLNQLSAWAPWFQSVIAALIAGNPPPAFNAVPLVMVREPKVEQV